MVAGMPDEVSGRLPEDLVAVLEALLGAVIPVELEGCRGEKP